MQHYLYAAIIVGSGGDDVEDHQLPAEGSELVVGVADGERKVAGSAVCSASLAGQPSHTSFIPSILLIHIFYSFPLFFGTVFLTPAVGWMVTLVFLTAVMGWMVTPVFLTPTVGWMVTFVFLTHVMGWMITLVFLTSVVD